MEAVTDRQNTKDDSLKWITNKVRTKLFMMDQMKYFKNEIFFRNRYF